MYPSLHLAKKIGFPSDTEAQRRQSGACTIQFMVTPTGVSLSRIEAARHSRLDAGACYYLSAAASSSV